MSVKEKIAIHGVPRSGTTWLGEIFNSSPNVLYKFQPLFSYELKDFLHEQSSHLEINEFFEKLEVTNSNFLDQTESKQRGITPNFNKEIITHLIYKEVRYHHILKNMLLQDSNLKVIGIIRSPMAVINSWLNAPREFRVDLGWNELEEWEFASKKNQNKPEEFYGYFKWKEVALLFHELHLLHPNRFYLQQYNQLLTNTGDEVNNLFKFCNLDMNDQTLSFIKKSRATENSDVYSVYKSKASDDNWKNSLNNKIIEAIYNDLTNSPLSIYL